MPYNVNPIPTMAAHVEEEDLVVAGGVGDRQRRAAMTIRLVSAVKPVVVDLQRLFLACSAPG